MKTLTALLEKVNKVKSEIQIGKDIAARGASSSFLFNVSHTSAPCYGHLEIRGQKDAAKFAELLREYIQYKEQSIANDVDQLNAIEGLLNAGTDNVPSTR